MVPSNYVSENGKIHVITCDINLEKLIPNDEINKDIQRVWVLFIKVGFVCLNYFVVFNV